MVVNSLKESGPRQCEGATLIEFALVFPVFLLLLFGILYFGIYLFTQQSVKNAAQQGANAAVVVDVDSAGNNLAPLVLARVNDRVAASLSFLPGRIGELQEGKLSANGQCGAGTGPGFVCVTGPDNDGGYDVAVHLTPGFSDLWPDFPNLLAFLSGGRASDDRLDARAKVRLSAGPQGSG